MRHPNWTHDSVLAVIRCFAKKHGRVPRHDEYRMHIDGLPSSATVYKHCSDFYACLVAEGMAIPPPPRRSAPGHAWRKQTFRNINT